MNSNEKRCKQRILHQLNRFQGLSTMQLCRLLPHGGYIIDRVLEIMEQEGDIVFTEGTPESGHVKLKDKENDSL